MIRNLINREKIANNIPNSYYLQVDQTVQPEHYKSFVGGNFNEIGDNHLSILKEYGLKPEMKFIDIGCGVLRSGVKIINYLNEFNYYGIDVNPSLLNHGYYSELMRHNLHDKVSEENFCITDCFDIEQFNVKFDMGLAQSVFTHLPINHLQYCLLKIAPFFNRGGEFFATFWFCDEDEDITKTKTFVSDITVQSDLIYDYYHLKRSQLTNLMQWHELKSLWDLKFLPDNHPRLQNWVVFSRK